MLVEQANVFFSKDKGNELLLKEDNIDRNNIIYPSILGLQRGGMASFFYDFIINCYKNNEKVIIMDFIKEKDFIRYKEN